jgi:hypothetical protein
MGGVPLILSSNVEAIVKDLHLHPSLHRNLGHSFCRFHTEADVDVVAFPKDHFKKAAPTPHAQGFPRVLEDPRQQLHLGLEDIPVLQEPAVVFGSVFVESLI